MQIVQATLGVFHHFELARELLLRGHLKRIYSTFPWRRLEREEISRDLVETFPWVHTPQILLSQRGLLSPSQSQVFSGLLGPTFDWWLKQRIPACDALISLSSTVLETGRLVQSRGGVFVCDRGSTHRRFQARIVEQEHRLWNQPHLPEDERDVAREERIFEQADAIVVPSQAARRSFLEQGFAAEKVHTIPYGARLDRFRPTGQPPSGPDARFEVLFVGAVSLRKGIPYLLQAFARLKHPRKRLRVIGAVPAELKPLLARLPQDQVEFLGSLPQAELPGYMSTSHVMVLPSIEEGLALVQGQALACGCPIIASAATGAEDLFTDGVEGFIVPIRSPESIAERLEQLAGDPELRARMSAAALRRVQQVGGWREYGDRWEALLHALTGKI